MELAAKLGAQLALSALSRVTNKLASNFGGDVTAAEIEHLKVFFRYEIVALTREAKSDDLVHSIPLLDKLQAAALDLEDLLDLYEYNQLEKQVSSSSSNPIKKFMPKFKEKLGSILPKSPLRTGLENLLKFVEQVEKKHPFITSRKDTAQPQASSITPTTSILLSPYFGRVNQCDSIIRFLLDKSHADSSSSINKVPVIAIVGMGGSGKSHTVQRICDDARIKNHFNANMWVHVTRDFDVVGLTKKMLESANNDGCPQITNLDVLQKKLIESLSNRKRFLFVLDDVWCEDMMKWDLLVGPLNKVARNGSKIIITTRMENIAYNLHAKKFHLEELTIEECWAVLKHYAFGNYEEIIDDEELINVGNQIIGKAKHSPLALRVVGSSLSNKRSINEWEKILKHDILKETMDLLLFSYQCLPLHLQQCFAYCSLFPKGYVFNFEVLREKPHLISLWIVQGFIENTNDLTLEEAGMKFFEELLSYSFFEKKTHVIVGDFFVIHDLLHDLAENVSKKQCHRIEYHDSLHVPTTCIHLSLNLTEESVIKAMSNIAEVSNIFKLRNLRSLIILQHDGSTNIFKSKKDIFQNLTKLRALYIGYVKQIDLLSDSPFDKLKHLRYLHIVYNNRLHTSLTKLYQLQFYYLDTFYADVSSGMISLRNLSLCGTLSIASVSNKMISLRNLPLCGTLSIVSLENVKCKEEAEEAILNQKKNIDKLVFNWSETSSSVNTCKEILEGLEPQRNLKALIIEGYQGVKLPNWMVKENWLPRLQELTFRSCTSLKIVPFLPPQLLKLDVCECDELMQLPPLSDTLRTLRLCYCPKLMPPSMFNKSPGLCDVSFFTNLRTLQLKGFPKLQALTNLSPTMRCLEVSVCPQLKSLGNLQRCTFMDTLIIKKCPMLKREEPTLVEGVVEGDIANHHLQVKAVWTDDPLLIVEFLQQQAIAIDYIDWLLVEECAAIPNLEKFSSLEVLKIRNCPKLELLPNLPVSLRFIVIWECPKLKEKYEEGGPLRNTISHIPHIVFRVGD